MVLPGVTLRDRPLRLVRRVLVVGAAGAEVDVRVNSDTDIIVGAGDGAVENDVTSSLT